MRKAGNGDLPPDSLLTENPLQRNFQILISPKNLRLKCDRFSTIPSGVKAESFVNGIQKMVYSTASFHKADIFVVYNNIAYKLLRLIPILCLLVPKL